MRRILFAAVALFTLGCGEDPTGPAVVERYVLVRLNNLPLPWVRVETSTTKEEILSGEIVLRENGVYTDRTVVRTRQGSINSTYDIVLQGPYEITGPSYKFTVISEEDQSGNDFYTGTLALDTLTVQAGATTWKYARR